MDEKKKTENKVREGLPMSEQSLKEWQQTFIDMEDNIRRLYQRRSVCQKKN